MTAGVHIDHGEIANWRCQKRDLTCLARAVHRGNPSPTSIALSSGRDGSQFSIHSDRSSGLHNLPHVADVDGEIEASIVPIRLEFDDEIVTPALETQALTPELGRSVVPLSPRHRLDSTASQRDSDDKEENRSKAFGFRTPLQTLSRSTSVQLEPDASLEFKRHPQVIHAACGRANSATLELTEATPSGITYSRNPLAIPETV